MKSNTFKNWPSSNTIKDIPRSHWGKHLHNFEKPKDALVESVSSFVDQWESNCTPAPRLILTGKQGRGKTHIAVGTYRHAVYKTDLSECKYIYVPEFCSRVLDSYGTSDENPFDELKTISLLVLDDLFGANLNKHERSRILPRLITTAYDFNHSLLVTSNYPVKDMSAMLPPHEMSRLLQNSVELAMTSDKDRRLIQ